MRVLTIGTFDLLHHGHIALIEFCEKVSCWRQVIVGVNSDRFVAAHKGAPPVQDEQTRMRALNNMYHRAEVVLHDGDTPAFIEQTAPHVIVVGSDWAELDYRARLGVDQRWLDLRGISICYKPRTPGISSSILRARMAQ